MSTAEPKTARMEGVHCTLEVARPRVGVVLITIAGMDTGELGDAPFRELAPDVAGDAPLELFIDTRATRGASINVSTEWALWLRKHRPRLRQVTMLTGSPFIRVTADFVRRFAELGDVMRVTTDPAAFDAALAEALRENPPYA